MLSMMAERMQTFMTISNCSRDEVTLEQVGAGYFLKDGCCGFTLDSSSCSSFD